MTENIVTAVQNIYESNVTGAKDSATALVSKYLSEFTPADIRRLLLVHEFTSADIAALCEVAQLTTRWDVILEILNSEDFSVKDSNAHWFDLVPAHVCAQVKSRKVLFTLFNARGYVLSADPAGLPEDILRALCQRKSADWLTYLHINAWIDHDYLRKFALVYIATNYPVPRSVGAANERAADIDIMKIYSAMLADVVITKIIELKVMQIYLKIRPEFAHSARIRVKYLS